MGDFSTSEPLTLSVGGRRYSAYSEGEGPLVLCLHGFPDTVYTWRHMLPALAKAGYRAVAVTLRGYEPSSQPSPRVRSANYRVTNLAQDVADWIEALGASSAHLVSHDWGSTIAYAAANKNPDLIRSITAMAVPHPSGVAAHIAKDKRQRQASSYILFFQLRGLAEAWIRRNNFACFDRMWARWSPGWDDSVADRARLKEAFGKPGVLEAALAYYRGAADRKDKESMSLLSGPISAPTLGLFGENDGCILPHVFRSSMRPKDFPGGVKVEEIRDAGHFLHLEQPDRVHEHVLSFLGEQPDP